MAGEVDLCCSNVCFLPLGIIGVAIVVVYILTFLHVPSETAAWIAIAVAIMFGICAFFGRQLEYFKQNKQ